MKNKIVNYSGKLIKVQLSNDETIFLKSRQEFVTEHNVINTDGTVKIIELHEKPLPVQTEEVVKVDEVVEKHINSEVLPEPDKEIKKNVRKRRARRVKKNVK